MSVKVAVRVRPFNERQKFLGCLNCIQMKENTTILINPRDRNQKQHQFTFDYSLWSHDGYEVLENGYLYPVDDRYIDQRRIFKVLGEDIIQNAWKGYNCCLFAYGQTGAGKSYSIIGYEENRGILPMASQVIFAGMQKTKIKGEKQFQLYISMLQIYNEKVQDLFIHTSKRPTNGLRIRQSKALGVYVEGLTKYQVFTYQDIERRMDQGSKNRSLASTLMNQYSSRAHTIVMIEFIQKDFITVTKMNKRTSLINIVDLAGSERVSKTGILGNKDRLKEASQINKSLHTLGRVIESLADVTSGKGKTLQIPYRQSALTRILETALGGNSVTTMICAISPANDNYEETLSTLRYADQTKRIKNKPIINESAVDKIIRELREENQKLKQMLKIAKLKGVNFEENLIEANIQEIQREIKKNMQSFAINTDEEEDEDLLLMSGFIDLPEPSEFGDGFSDISEKNAYLTNLNEDQLLCFKIQYSCDDELYVGNKNLEVPYKQKMILCGLGIEEKHAYIHHQNGKYFLKPLSETASDYIYLNGKTINRPVEIFHNDRIIFGTNSVFLFKNKAEEERPGTSIKQKQIDYEYAIHERNQQMMEISQLNTSANISKTDEYTLLKLQEIEKEFEQLKRQNERKMKEKEEKFIEEMRKMEMEREVQKTKLQLQLREKQAKAEKIAKEKERVEKLRDKLLKKQQQRRQKERKFRQTLLLDMEDSPEKQTPQVRVQYVDQHHFHYEYNVVQPQIQQKFKQKPQEITLANTNSFEESLLTHDQSSPQKIKKIEEILTKKKNFGIQKTIEINQQGFKKAKEETNAIQKDNLNITNILYEEKIVRPVDQQQEMENEENLLNSTLQQYLPQNQKQQSQNTASRLSQKQSKGGSVQISLNLSELSEEADKTNIKQLELANRIKELEEKLQQLQKSQKIIQEETQQSKAKRSFGERPNSDNFNNDGSLNLSAIEITPDEGSSFERNLKKNFIQCKNENILNQRTIQIRKRKRQGEEIRKILMKKYKGQINKQLITLIPMIEKFNLWARQMNRNIQTKISIEYHNFTNYEAVEVLKNRSYKNKINIQIQIINYEEGRRYKWPLDIFENRYELVESIFQKYIENPNSQLFIRKDKEKDPFWQPHEYQPYAFAYLSLECLLYGLDFEGDICFVRKGKPIGHLNVRINPIKQKQKSLNHSISEYYQAETPNLNQQILDPRHLLQKDVFFTMQINTFTPTEHCPSEMILKYMISYELLEGAYKIQKYETPERNINNQEIMYMYKHKLKDVSQNILGYLADSPVVFTFHVISQIDENLANMTSSFLDQSKSESSFNTSSFIMSQTSQLNAVSDSGSIIQSKKGQVFENVEIISKINSDMKKYNSDKKKIQERIELERSNNKPKLAKKNSQKDCVIF